MKKFLILFFLILFFINFSYSQSDTLPYSDIITRNFRIKKTSDYLKIKLFLDSCQITASDPISIKKLKKITFNDGTSMTTAASGSGGWTRSGGFIYPTTYTDKILSDSGIWRNYLGYKYRIFHAIIDSNNTYVGNEAGVGQKGRSFTGVGMDCGYKSMGDYFTGVGAKSGLNQNSEYFTGSGFYSGGNNTGSGFVGFGPYAGYNNSLDSVFYAGLGQIMSYDTSNILLYGRQTLNNPYLKVNGHLLIRDVDQINLDTVLILYKGKLYWNIMSSFDSTHCWKNLYAESLNSCSPLTLYSPDSIILNSPKISINALGMSAGYNCHSSDTSISIGRNNITVNNGYAFGLNSSASNGGCAIGNGATASEWQSTALNGGTASKYMSLAGGDSEANGWGFSVAFGEKCLASGDHAFTVGSRDTASGTSSFATGQSCTASATAAFAGGYGSVASAPYGFAFGFEDTATVFTTFAIGHNCAAKNNNAGALNWNSKAYGRLSLAINQSITNGIGAFASGYSQADGNASSSFGRNTLSYGSNSTSFGYITVSGGDNSIAMGDSCKLYRYDSIRFHYKYKTSYGDTVYVSQNNLQNDYLLFRNYSEAYIFDDTAGLISNFSIANSLRLSNDTTKVVLTGFSFASDISDGILVIYTDTSNNSFCGGAVSRLGGVNSFNYGRRNKLFKSNSVNLGGEGNEVYGQYSGNFGGVYNKIYHDYSFTIGAGLTTKRTYHTYVNNLVAIDTIAAGRTITINKAGIVMEKDTLANGLSLSINTITQPSGGGQIYSDSAGYRKAFAYFTWGVDGTINIPLYDNADDADTPGTDICIFYSGGRVYIKNNSGYERTFKYIILY